MSEVPGNLSLPYRHTQIGYMNIVGLAFGLATQIGSLLRDLRRRRGRLWVQVPFTALSAALLVVFASLRVEVDESQVTASFTGGALPRRIALERIEAARVRRLPWYTGWGIRRTRAGWVYNVSGRGAVELTLADGVTFCIGSDQPDDLLAAIDEARGLATMARNIA